MVVKALCGIVTFLITFVISSISLFHNTHCEQIVQRTFLWIAFSLAIVSLVCCICYYLPGCSSCNDLITILIWLFFLSYNIFGFTVTRKGEGDKLLGKEYKEYRLDRYSPWLQNRINDTDTWHEVKKCLIDRNACKKMTKNYANFTAEKFYAEGLSAIESGCCKPSNECNFSYVTPTNWTKTVNSSNTNPDCALWNNEPNIWCFGCQSCKAGVADKFKDEWSDIMNFKKG